MSTVTFAVNDDMQEWIKDRVAESNFDTTEGYLGDILIRERARNDEQRIAELRRIVDESLASGVSTRSINEIFAEAIEITKANGTYRE